VRGFFDFLCRLVREEAPTHLAVAFDGSLTTSFRNDFFPAYKSGRPAPPADLERQLALCAEVAAAFGARTFVDPRFEADDLIAALARDRDAVVVTSDKDLAQLVSERVTLLDFAKARRYGPAEVQERFGVAPARIPDLLALTGDKVDAIPGVKGVGAKTAVALLSRFGDLETLYARLDEVAALPLRGAAGLARRLAEGKETAFLSKRLATLAPEAPARATLDELRYGGADPDRLPSLLERLGLAGLRDGVPCWAPGAR
jgi:5'-3' exonuclease